MKPRTVLPVLALVLFWSGAALGQDPVKVSPEVYKVAFENASLRVLKVAVAPGAKTAMHLHPENVIIALSAAKVRFTGPDGKSVEPTLANESATFAPAETHAGENIGKAPIEAIVVEFKSKAPGTSTLPNTRDNLASKVLAENPRAVAYRATADPKFHEPAGSKHEFDQVVIALAPSQMSLAMEGKPAKTSWARGDVQVIPRGTAHESQNTGGKPTEFIIVAVK
jgi:oxalate decarboxylase/phosphoglucose isomerase-like protein (cupin superfamily)